MTAVPLTRSSSEWQNHPDRGCKGTNPDMWFPVEVDPETHEEYEPSYASPEVKRICDACPVRPECLEWALADNVEGIWAGTTTYERQLLKSPKRRKTCVTCGSIDVVTERNHNICLACGVSCSIW